ncbi:hypothetical protein CONPUDRAFT_136103 [Coniophora puteana RWD-64-598 SS2]|uniref:E3 ubiquitin protein ligase n=1 Tax=Coniophora puteana (strain RWD-64-598) TaxID=741705 RepID=A0A5M3MUN2_CONPW|nr:uncharacterized protein CONPUDRAFT_136103 [Coniophora puteana RWD-64-598 SS2]EIW82882.1 hypothetical protein CONPUDRAFT_136103 [Coniophora puteana RWD-64-598 SS2]
METKKRHFAGDGELSQSKKRAVSGVNGLPEPKGADQAAPEADKIELFRKDAIFRRMRHYSRENEKSQMRIAQLEQRKSTCEAGLMAMAACWEQLVNTIHALTPQEQLSVEDMQTDDLFELSKHVSSDSSLKVALEKNMLATQKLVTSFMKMGHQPPAASHHATLIQKSQRECSALRSQLALVQTKLEGLEDQNQKYQEELTAAEMRIDRLQSSVVAETLVGKPKEGKEEPKDEKGKSPPRQAHSPPVGLNGYDRDPELERSLRSDIEQRDQEILKLRSERSTLADENIRLKVEAQSPSEEAILQCPAVKYLQERVARAEAVHAQSHGELQKQRDELDKLKASRVDFEETLRTEVRKEVQEAKASFDKAQDDIQRLRAARDSLTSTVQSYKHKESVKMRSVDDLKALVDARSERIKVLQSEVARCKARIAGQEGHADLMRFFFEGKVEDVDYVSELERKLKDAQSKLAAHEETLASFNVSNPDVAAHAVSEAAARQQLADARAELDRYRSMIGAAASSVSPSLLEEKDEELNRLRLSMEEREQAEKTLYAELDQLSTQWEGLDARVKTQTQQLKGWEERLAKAVNDKGRMETKYFAILKEKEAGEAERKTSARHGEKQTKAIEKMQESERSLIMQIAECEKENTTLKRTLDNQKEILQRLDMECKAAQGRQTTDHERMRSMQAAMMAELNNERQKSAHAKKVEADLVSTRKELEAARERENEREREGSRGKGREKERGMSDVEKAMKIINCSNCKLRPREVALTKCMHTFCKECVDARISTRQRRCPHCNLGFAQSDVETVYWQ